jgi:hypothetical protein
MNAGVPSKASLPPAVPDTAATTPLVGVVRQFGMDPAPTPAGAASFYVQLIGDSGQDLRAAGPGIKQAMDNGSLALGQRVALQQVNDPQAGATWSVAPAPAPAARTSPADALRSVIDQVMAGRNAPHAPAPAGAPAVMAPADIAPAPATRPTPVEPAVAASAAPSPAAAGPAVQTPQQQAGAAAQVVAGAGLPAVLPRLSEYRLSQVEKAATTFAREQEAFWQASPALGAVRGQMQDAARQQGVPVEDVAQQMKPGGVLAALGQQFAAAVVETPAAGVHKKGMDKALDSYTRQYGRAQEEILNPDMNNNPHYDGLKGRLRETHEQMARTVAPLPGFTTSQGVQEPSHFEKMQGAVGQIMERIQTVSRDLDNLRNTDAPAGPSGP